MISNRLTRVYTKIGNSQIIHWMVRSTEPSSRSSVTVPAPNPPNIGKRVSKPKGPKSATLCSKGGFQASQ
ncbi:hypothetical protein DOY81_003673 [Sarcophaga bullata]|nr:hypothetical protein DOY81_003673 [Sarcophaga bullata]